jgi:stage II sporulation protein D
MSAQVRVLCCRPKSEVLPMSVRFCLSRLALAAILVCSGFSTAAADLKSLGDNPIIRVLLVDSVSSMCVTAKPAWTVSKLSGGKLGQLTADKATTIVLLNGELRLVTTTDTSAGIALGREAVVLESASEGGSLLIRKVPYGVGWWWESAEDRKYEGRIEIHPGPSGKLTVVAVLPLEQYLRGVVPSEIGADSPLEALCSQAVAARSAAVLALTDRIYAGTHHDICSDVACQAFSGISKCTAASDAAVTSTRGCVLVFDGKPVSAYYASNCGGFTEDIRNVWPDRASDRAYWGAACFDGEGTCTLDLTTESGVRSWIEGDPVVFCNPHHFKVPEWSKKYSRWTRDVATTELTARVALKKDVGRVVGIRPLKRGASGRLIEAEFVGEKGTLKVSPELAIRQVLDPPLKSAVFVVDAKGPADRPDAFMIRGAGWGHGVGMCQTGAVGMANSGKGFREILKHYYPNATVEKLY